jgi:hypothetical protein
VWRNVIDGRLSKHQAVKSRVHLGRMGVTQMERELGEREQLREGGPEPDDFRFRVEESAPYPGEEICPEG